MRRSIRRYLSMLLVMLMTVSAAAVICTKNAYAGSFSSGYISLGADLTEEEKSKVLELFGVDEKDLENYKVVYVTNNISTWTAIFQAHRSVIRPGLRY